MIEKKTTVASAIAAAAFVSASSALASEAITITHAGSQPAIIGAPGRFTGSVRVEDSFKATAPATVGGATVTFEPGARTAWHTHPLGQTLIVTSGVGVVQMWDGPQQEIRSSDTVWIPPGVKHWHGASPRNGMTHIAFSESLDGKSVDWLELVTDAQYSPRDAEGQL
ncbi:cupin [Rhizobium leguminosarum bv. trifolii]|uniref:Cupin n=1 Tax=Rhizobium leguminosarum bv. trifolii TaxID=386 RepID=A0A3E1BRD9_RHILT|nr:cupin domain-containing protein [Rhizobium leguminosarum]RFB96556.1 cupin [Rhizobium leguminosarum bv. trifolii]RFB96679.1 cupin [Rhizobium leguminosarum bv. trifolii]